MKNSVKFAIFFISGHILFNSLVLCKEKIYIRGDKMKILGKENAVEFTDNVKLEYKNILLSSNYVRNYEKKDIVEVKDDIEFNTIVNSSDTVRIFADSATLYIKNGKFEFTEKPHVQYVSSDNIVDIYGEYVEYDTSKGIMLARENVKICWKDNVAESSSAVYNEKDKVLSLYGKPKMKFNKEKIEAVYQADKIDILFDEEKIIFEGQVLGRINVKNEQ